MRLPWAQLAGLIVLLCLLIALAAMLGRLALGFLRERRGTSAGEPDPMFAEPAVQATMPPELWTQEGEPAPGDRSAGWSLSEQTPVDKTAGQLAEEETQND